MRIKRLELKNIRSYSELDITFPEGSTLLSGDIGSGKTSVLLGIQFGLFGLQPGQKGSSLLKSGEDFASVKLTLEIGGEETIIERTIRQSKSGSITQENNKITLEGIEEEISTSEMRSKVISILGYPKEFTRKSDLLYKFTVYTPQEGMKEIINERPDIRLDLLRHIFGIERYKRIKENCTTLIQNIKDSIKVKDAICLDLSTSKEKLVNERERKIRKTKENNDLNLDLINLRKEEGSIKIILNNLSKDLEQKQTLEKEISRKEIELDGKNILRKKVEREISLLREQLSNKIDFNQESLDNLDNLIIKHKSLREELNSNLMNTNSRISILISQREKNSSEKERINSLENCPTCFQNVGEEHKQKIYKKTSYDIEEIDRELEPLDARRGQIKKDLERSKELLEGYELDKLRLEREKIKFENQRGIDTKLKSEIFLLERIDLESKALTEEINSLRETSLKFSEKEQAFRDTNRSLEEVSIKLRRSEIIYAENNREIELLLETITDLETGITKKEKIRADSNYLREILEWLETKFLKLISFTEKNVLVKIRKDFSRLFSEWFSMLVSESLTVELDEEFTPLIYNKDYLMDYEFLSGGERTAIALSYRLALNQMINSVFSQIKTKNILILDEPTDGFSEQQLDKVRDILDQLQSKQMIIVSHEQKIDGFVDNVIRVKKEGTSRIEND